MHRCKSQYYVRNPNTQGYPYTSHYYARSHATCIHVPVLDSYEVTDEAVGGTALHKVLLCSEESLRVGGSKFSAEVVQQRPGLVLFLDLVQ